MVKSEQMSLMKQGVMMVKHNPKMAVKKNSWKKKSEKFRSILKANKRLKFISAGGVEVEDMVYLMSEEEEQLEL
jgi:hypothetical protein